MRPSKSRSRNKSNRNRSVGNVVNRVFDSSGPEGKVRGTPQQIIEKYNQLARDAQLGNDRVATENFQQHAEHYLRLLGAAQKEQEAKREQQERENRERQAERDRERAKRQERESNGTDDPGHSPQPEVMDSSAEEGEHLVETPESKSDAPKSDAPKRPRKPRAKQKGVKGAAASDKADESGGGGESAGNDEDGDGPPPSEAAE